jgi:predicted DNA-binding transcriptional regulator AlpA
MSNSVQTPEPVNNSVQTPETILRKQEVAEFLRWSKRQIEKKVKEGKFPKPFYISGGSPRWLLSDLTAWLDQTRAQSTSMCADKE